jgi:G3E family GTPase
LRGTITLDSVLTIIDAEQVLSLEGENRVLAILQVGAADIVAINKIDLVDDAQLQAVRQWTRQIIKEARIIETMHGTIPLEMILGVGAFDPLRLAQHDSHDVHVHTAGETHDHDHTHDHSMVFSTWSWESDEPLALKEIQRVISKLPTSVYRAKGVLYLVDDPLRRGILQVVGKRASVDWSEAWGDQKPHSQIVVIGEHDSIEPDAYNAMFERCLAVHAPKTELHRLATTALSWLRGGE